MGEASILWEKIVYWITYHDVLNKLSNWGTLYSNSNNIRVYLMVGYPPVRTQLSNKNGFCSGRGFRSLLLPDTANTIFWRPTQRWQRAQFRGKPARVKYFSNSLGAYRCAPLCHASAIYFPAHALIHSVNSELEACNFAARELHSLLQLTQTTQSSGHLILLHESCIHSFKFGRPRALLCEWQRRHGPRAAHRSVRAVAIHDGESDSIPPHVVGQRGRELSSTLCERGPAPLALFGCGLGDYL